MIVRCARLNPMPATNAAAVLGLKPALVFGGLQSSFVSRQQESDHRRDLAGGAGEDRNRDHRRAEVCTAGFLCCVPMAMPQGHLVAFCGDMGIVLGPPILSARKPQNWRLTNAQPSSTESIAAPSDGTR